MNFTSTNTTISETLTLRDYQEELVQQIMKLYQSGEKALLNTTLTGLGKTYMSLETAKRLNLPIFVVCPGMVVNKWTSLCHKFAIPYYEVISHQSLAGTSAKLNHPWLQRTDVSSVSEKGRITTTTTYNSTAQFRSIVESGLYLIFDEVQIIKNPNITSRSCIKLANVVTNSARSYMIGLSASPFDDESNAITIMKLLGCIDDSQRLYHYTKDKTVNEGLESLFEKCNSIDSEQTSIIRTDKVSRSTIKNICYRLYNIVKRRVTLGIFTTPQSLNNDKVFAVMRNVFYNINPIFVKELQDAINGLVIATRYENGKIQKEKGQVLGDIIRNLVQIEKAKAYDMALRANQFLNTKPGKVVLCVNYNETINKLNYYLAAYNPLIINGDVNTATREYCLDLFNAPNNNHRVIIMNTKSGGTGIDLHDTDGNFPRTMIISPCYSIISLIQAAGRTFREGVKSAVEIIIFYGSGNLQLEMNILEALARKSGYVRGSMPDNITHISYPGEYPCFKEITLGILEATENPITKMEKEAKSPSRQSPTIMDDLIYKTETMKLNNSTLASYCEVPMSLLKDECITVASNVRIFTRDEEKEFYSFAGR